MHKAAYIAPLIENLLPQLKGEDTGVIGVNLPVLESRLAFLSAKFPSQTEHCIAIKTHPHPEMLKHLVKMGYGLEAASIEEVQMALSAGCLPDKLVFDSPVKTRLEIAEVSNLAGMLVNVNSLGELDRYPADFKGILGIRVNPEVHTGAPELFNVSKKESKFGVPISDREAIVKAAVEGPVSALHMHSGSQMKDLEIQRGALEALRDLAAEINEQVPGKIKTLDIGGGLPTEELQEGNVLDRYGSMVSEVFHGTSFRLVTEFGQWVHAEAGFALSQIEYVIEQSRIFIHLGADFFMRDAYTTPKPYPLSIWNAEGTERLGHSLPIDIAGPLCFAGDYLAHQVSLPASVAEGDWLFVDHTGANTYALWSRHCSRTVPAVWAWNGKTAVKWSERRTIGF